MIKLASLLLLIIGLIGLKAEAAEQAADVIRLKQAILTQAEAYKGQGDSDRSKQKNLEVLVDQLLKASPQSDVKTRLPLLQGAWQQVWGPYIYKNNSRGVDPAINPDHIYQVVFPGGYYYNVSPDWQQKSSKPARTVLLRGEYTLDKHEPDRLTV
jgi:hypothetical protein